MEGYRGDIALGVTLRGIKFPTTVSGVPTTLAGSPVISAYIDDGLTQLTAGITLTVDFDGVVGLNNISVVATSGNGYAAQTDVTLVLTAGTVNGSSVIGPVAAFSIENRSALRPLTAGRTLDVTAANKVNGVVLVDTVTTYTGNTPQTGDNFARIGAAGAGLTAVPWNAAWDAEVESEVNDAINTAISELGVAAPSATPTLRTGMMLMYMALRNKLVVQTSGTDAIELYNDAGTKIAAKTINDNGSDYTENEMA